MVLCCAQKVKEVKAVYTYSASEDIPLSQIKSTAIERAKIQAIADEFGTVVSQINTTRVENSNGQSTVDFLSLGGSEVKGEWIETIEESVSSPVFEQNMIVVTATVRGRAREIVSAGVDFDAKILRNGTEDRFEDSNFRSGDDLYLSFTSPVDGYLAVYLIDAEQQAYCLLPYRNQKNGNFPIKANQRYLLFDSQAVPPTERTLIDEYTMTCSSSSEQNYIYIIFSPQSFTKAIDNVSDEILPRNLTYDAFQRWLVKCRNKDENMKVQIVPIKIKKIFLNLN